MAQWFVKDLSRLTQVSVQTLHHYDRIGLLQPSLRLANGYRVYTEKDLLRLQQIIASKYFGFELQQIKTLLDKNTKVIDQFLVQSEFLEEKAKTLQLASDTLKRIISECGPDKSLPWETIIQLIEVYRMTQELENKWAAKVLTPEELKEYAGFEKGLKTRFSPEQKAAFEQNWAALIGQIGMNLDKDPIGEIGISLSKRCMELVNSLYGKKHAGLRSSIWEKGFKTGKIDGENALSPEIVNWLDRAMDAYYRNQIYSILDEVGTKSHDGARTKWNDLMAEMCGESQTLKDGIVDAAQSDVKVSATAKNWLKTNSKS